MSLPLSDLLAPALYAGSAYALTKKPLRVIATATHGKSLGNRLRVVREVKRGVKPDVGTAALLMAPALLSTGMQEGPSDAAKELLGGLGGMTLGAILGLKGAKPFGRKDQARAATLLAALGAGLGAKMASEKEAGIDLGRVGQLFAGAARRVMAQPGVQQAGQKFRQAVAAGAGRAGAAMPSATAAGRAGAVYDVTPGTPLRQIMGGPQTPLLPRQATPAAFMRPQRPLLAQNATPASQMRTPPMASAAPAAAQAAPAAAPAAAEAAVEAAAPAAAQAASEPGLLAKGMAAAPWLMVGANMFATNSAQQDQARQAVEAQLNPMYYGR